MCRHSIVLENPTYTNKKNCKVNKLNNISDHNVYINGYPFQLYVCKSNMFPSYYSVPYSIHQNQWKYAQYHDITYSSTYHTHQILILCYTFLSNYALLIHILIYILPAGNLTAYFENLLLFKARQKQCRMVTWVKI